MGSYLEKNIQTFIDLQAASPSSPGLDDASFTPEVWTPVHERARRR